MWHPRLSDIRISSLLLVSDSVVLTSPPENLLLSKLHQPVNLLFLFFESGLFVPSLRVRGSVYSGQLLQIIEIDKVVIKILGLHHLATVIKYAKYVHNVKRSHQSASLKYGLKSFN